MSTDFVSLNMKIMLSQLKTKNSMQLNKLPNKKIQRVIQNRAFLSIKPKLCLKCVITRV